MRPGHQLAHFLSSHDVPGALWQLGNDVTLFRLAAVLQFTTAGIPVIYYGEEVARAGGEWPDNRSDMPWGDRRIRPGAGRARDDSLRADYRRLVAIRRSHPALSRGRHEGLASEGDLLVFARRDSLSGDAVVVAVNRGSTSASASVAPPREWNGIEKVTDLWNRVGLATVDGRLPFTVEPRAARILAREQ